MDSIETNKKYYRIGINKNQRFKKVINKDSQTIKEINSLINKLTNDNYEKIKSTSSDPTTSVYKMQKEL